VAPARRSVPTSGRGYAQRVQPIGREIAVAAKALDRAFSAALAQAGGSLPVWLILLALKQRAWRTQQDLAAAVGIEGPTLTHHLDGMESAGLIARTRDPRDRRAVRVELTADGEARFHALREAAIAFDRRLRAGVSDAEAETLRALLGRLRENVAPDVGAVAAGGR
jgi:MarR family transcriptional regulator, transcriptional regulator for hemolysin